MNKKKSGVLFCVVAVILSMVITLSSCSPVKLTKIKSDSFTQSVSKNAGDSFHKVKRSDFEFVCKSGLIEMYYNKVTDTVGILDTSANTFWSTLPMESEKKSLQFSALEVVLSNGGKEEYVLNSQDNAVAFGNAEREITKNSIIVKYHLASDKETGRTNIDELKNKEIRADITVTYTLSDGSFYASISMNQVSLPKGVTLEKVRFLNSFGAYSDSDSEDFIFIPDGSGALIKTGVPDKEFSPVTLSVYGDDSALTSGVNSALLGTFGIKHGAGAFLCVIESGETVASIAANRVSDKSINSVGAEFSITDVSLSKGRTKQTKTIGYEFSGEIRLCYRFLSGKSATYSGMAAACRENLIRNSVISSKSVDADGSSFPLIVNLQFGYCDKKGKIFVKSTFEQAKDLMTLLKAKGVNSAILRADGLFKNANNGTNDKFGEFIKQLGSNEDYEALYSYLKTQNFPLFIDTNVLTFEKDNSKGAKNISGKKMMFINNEGKMRLPASKQQYLPLTKLEDKIESLLYSSSPISFDGYALNDMGAFLYSDYSSDFFSRETSKIEISSQVSVLASYKSVMIDNGNFYSIKNADTVSSLPFGTSAKKENDSYRAIPFVELILHGTYDYSTESINLSDDAETAFLRAVEYGALLSVDWHCESNGKDDKYDYNNNINEIVSYCIKANDILADLRSARMTSHHEVQNGVFCTEYNNSTKVYVNYTEKDVTINGIKVNARDCVKIS